MAPVSLLGTCSVPDCLKDFERTSAKSRRAEANFIPVLAARSMLWSEEYVFFVEDEENRPLWSMALESFSLSTQETGRDGAEKKAL